MLSIVSIIVCVSDTLTLLLMGNMSHPCAIAALMDGTCFLPAVSTDVQSRVLTITCAKPATGAWPAGFRVNLTAMVSATGRATASTTAWINATTLSAPTIVLVGAASPACNSSQSVGWQYKVMTSASNASFYLLPVSSSRAVNCAATPNRNGEQHATERMFGATPATHVDLLYFMYGQR